MIKRGLLNDWFPANKCLFISLFNFFELIELYLIFYMEFWLRSLAMNMLSWNEPPVHWDRKSLKWLDLWLESYCESIPLALNIICSSLLNNISIPLKLFLPFSWVMTLRLQLLSGESSISTTYGTSSSLFILSGSETRNCWLSFLALGVLY